MGPARPGERTRAAEAAPDVLGPLDIDAPGAARRAQRPERHPAPARRAYWEATHPYSMGGSYINFMMEEGPERVQATYRGHYQRLTDIKSTYDPQNFFRVNQNIRPA
jgi:hypothetical protein